jgi:hypothetical protein
MVPRSEGSAARKHPASINANKPEHADVWKVAGGKEAHMKSATWKTENSSRKPNLISSQGTTRWYVTDLVHLASIQE